MLSEHHYTQLLQCTHAVQCHIFLSAINSIFLPKGAETTFILTAIFYQLAYDRD